MRNYQRTKLLQAKPQRDMNIKEWNKEGYSFCFFCFLGGERERWLN